MKKLEINSYRELRNLIVSGNWYIELMQETAIAYKREKAVFAGKVTDAIIAWLEIPKRGKAQVSSIVHEALMMADPTEALEQLKELSTVAKLRWELEKK